MIKQSTPLSRLILVTGPARSGKSEWAETLAKNSGLSVIYIATSQLNSTDTEWQNRIQKHKIRRPPEWNTLEVPVELAPTLQQISQPDTCILVDSLGTWLANILEQDDEVWQDVLEDLITTLTQTSGEIIFVAEETGWGVVPAYPIGRTFRDRLGMLTRKIGMIANPVYLIMGGHVLNLSQLGSALEL
ncbi:bifunctional adenosylcobinamide kinase/adenosylcobinamide-phosphate guanylyltransferase [Limnoraphis robusta]|uniref:Adenosylcobinamide kinase n=1 Tax=Limnoraphis robusta CCNP1315 TaxID=3110306 RepID=A0ABU5U5Q2_9CYAN|nr:bifunctional adenosylcobinamide kinase/adenosylcobinamide-phosphate guanylyltransferase [Limnoraphis robusta]MEA5496722.1 bifunctional adenosylcobinamide kinase/adenosylcobinamide-phosphate guanylyltransferase [Limnoraphis robusta BA-68 BA1]MEA5522454.1 bifunctional adenosylcobinamide kinase/adenosylcobinamide-phosphate guanylyltransferase [Limnoraphis robusta CCNP1315]MEA5546213.1 bifunctional adenosylcobinamide kinase/adenosylcobinamide-phosphate guanylyltransferase [Limnoraphis robusta CCN